MLKLECLQDKHYKELYLVYLESEQYYKYDYEAFVMAMSKRQGFVVCDDNKIIGASYSYPDLNIFSTDWRDTTTPWTSLGTIVFPQPSSGYIIVRRLV